jgi:anti-anti-sigma regulatory factor
MAAKKKASQPKLGQENEKMIMESSVEVAEMPQEQFVSNDDELIAVNSDSLSEAFSSPEHLEDGQNEVAMNFNADEQENDVSEQMVADEVAEPVINLDPTLSIQNVVKLYEKLKKSYAAYDAIEIDASHVTSIDTATLQLFVALKKDSVKQNKEVVFFQPSPRFIESAKLLDLVEALDIIDT